MTLEEYQKMALERLNPNIAKPNKEGMRFCCMGLLEETGEIVAELRKPLFKGNFHEHPLDKEAIKGEIGDLMWYMALACRNNNINIEKLSKKETEYDEDDDRKEIIKNSIKLGKQSGRIVDNYLKFNKGKIEKKELEKSLRKQYKNISKLSCELNISMDDILDYNIRKVNGRYDKDGHANIEGEER